MAQAAEKSFMRHRIKKPSEKYAEKPSRYRDKVETS
jgi:hypothetical protein